MKKIILAAVITLFGFTAFAQSNKGETIVIQTNGVCKMCEDRFMEHVPYWKGVKDCSYDAKTAKLTIVYDAKKTNPDALRKGISKLGYDADDVKADAAAREKLPACCKNPAANHDHSGCGHDHSDGHKH